MQIIRQPWDTIASIHLASIIARSFGSDTGLPDFPWYSAPKRGKCTKKPTNVPNNQQKYQMGIK
jgi:hypothetical protein